MFSSLSGTVKFKNIWKETSLYFGMVSKQELRLFKVYKTSIHLYCDSHDGGQKNAHQPIFSFNVIEGSPTSLACNFVFIGPNNLILVQRHVVWSYRSYQNLEQIDHNLHNHVFNDVLCKPPKLLRST